MLGFSMYIFLGYGADHTLAVPAYPRGLYIDIRRFAGALKGFAYPRYAKRELARMRPGVFSRKDNRGGDS